MIWKIAEVEKLLRKIVLRLIFKFVFEQQVNPVNVGAGKKNSLTAAELESKKIWVDPSLKKVPDIELTFAFDFYPIDNSNFHKPHLYGFNQGKNYYSIIFYSSGARMCKLRRLKFY